MKKAREERGGREGGRERRGERERERRRREGVVEFPKSEHSWHRGERALVQKLAREQPSSNNTKNEMNEERSGQRILSDLKRGGERKITQCRTVPAERERERE